MLQPTFSDCLRLDLRSHLRDFGAASEIGVGGCQVGVTKVPICRSHVLSMHTSHALDDTCLPVPRNGHVCAHGRRQIFMTQVLGPSFPRLK